MGDVGSARYEPALLPPCPTIRVLSYSNCHLTSFLRDIVKKFSTLKISIYVLVVQVRLRAKVLHKQVQTDRGLK